MFDFCEELALIYNVYILTKDGLCVHHRKYSGQEYDEVLVTGFLMQSHPWERVSAVKNLTRLCLATSSLFQYLLRI